MSLSMHLPHSCGLFLHRLTPNFFSLIVDSLKRGFFIWQSYKPDVFTALKGGKYEPVQDFHV